MVIEDNRIVAAGPASVVQVPADATVIDTSGRTKMPGLIEAHAHLDILGHGDYNRWYPWRTQNGYSERAMEISAKHLLNAGITSAIDLGALLKESLSVRDRINRGEILSPRDRGPEWAVLLLEREAFAERRRATPWSSCA